MHAVSDPIELFCQPAAQRCSCLPCPASQAVHHADICMQDAKQFSSLRASAKSTYYELANIISPVHAPLLGAPGDVAPAARVDHCEVQAVRAAARQDPMCLPGRLAQAPLLPDRRHYARSQLTVHPSPCMSG
jgi:hypothetical protein